MKLRDSLSLMWVAVGGVCTLGAVLTGVVFVENRDLKSELRSARVDYRQETERLRELTEARADLALELEKQQGRVKGLEEQLALAKANAAAGKTGEGSTNGPGRFAQAAVRAQVYAGRQRVGEAWVFPSGAAREDGRRDLVVSLDEAVRTALTPAAPRAEPPRAAPPVTVNYNYPASPWGYAGWPVYWGVVDGGTNCPGGNGDGPRFPQPPQRSTPDQRGNGNGGIWRPTEKPYLPNPSTWPVMTPQQRSGGTLPVSRPATAVPSTGATGAGLQPVVPPVSRR